MTTDNWEPVAYVRTSRNVFTPCRLEICKSGDDGAVQVFTHPPAPQPVVREPLTDEQIHAIYDEVARRESYAGAVTRRSIVRAIEAAHGIKGGQHGTE